jgi:hypothetical protein
MPIILDDLESLYKLPNPVVYGVSRFQRCLPRELYTIETYAFTQVAQ